MALQFRADTEPGKVLYRWRTELEENKGYRAALRRCREPLEALFVPAYHDLYHDLLRQDGCVDSVKLPAIAALAAHVTQVRGEKQFAQQMAAPKVQSGTTPQVSELRFRRLLQCETVDELFPALRRVVHLLDGSVNLYNLANSVYWWGDQKRREWAYAYYGDLQS
jgi:CRISPR system Cascade subunit CasB